MSEVKQGVHVDDLSQDQLNKITEWTQKSASLKEVKPAEMSLRKEVFGFAFPDPKKGVNKLPLYNGYILKATYKIEKYLDKAALPAILKAMEEKREGSTEGLIRYKPELDAKAYGALDDEMKKIFDECITEKPASPALEMVEPKVK